MAIVKYLMQGLDEEKNHLFQVKKLLGKKYNQIVITSAYLREKGVELIEEELASSKAQIICFIGIRNGVTSYQALKRLLNTNVALFIVDTGSVNLIFHPKQYVGWNDKKARAIVGSANFTPAGLVRNIEASSVIKLDLEDENDLEYLENFKSSIRELLSYDENVICINNENMIEELLEEGRIVDEEKQPIIQTVGANKTTADNASTIPKMKLKTAKISNGKKKEKTKAKKVKSIKGKLVGNINNKRLQLEEVWESKGLVKRDLNIPSDTGRTNVTGSMLLKKGVYKVDQQTYFRDKVFNDLDWINIEGKPEYFEYATMECRFVINGVYRGEYKLVLKHDTRKNTRTYEEKQPMTHLIWGECKALIADRNLVGRVMKLYRIKNTNKYLIDIE
ncbi:TPA: phospholipase D family protein [Clostridium perfringens]|uniref:phospholipase D family protein n=1 Tax=Clostridium perfringens TaxID=1502 RepID=UPI0039ECFB49